MNILVYRYGSICEPDFISGFRELGNNVHELSYEMADKCIPADRLIRLVSQELDQHSYDFVFSINFFPFLSEVCNIYHIRYLCQTVDSPVMELFSYSVTNPWNRIFLFDMQQYREIAPLNPDCVFHLPLATNPSRWDSVINNATAGQIQKYSSDISFVGSLYTEKCPYNRFTGSQTYLGGYLEGLMNSQERIYGYHFLEECLTDSMVDEFRAHLPGFYTPPELFRRDDRIAMVRLYMDAKISVKERLHIMQIVGNHFGIDLYTGSNTDGLPVRNRGLAKSLTEMPLIFHHSKINLNITSKSIREGLPLRIFDVLGCGGFLITNYQSEIPELFTPDEDLVLYDSYDDLVDKIEFYLAHENRRKEIAHNGHEKVCRFHNYPERILQMISLAYGL